MPPRPNRLPPQVIGRVVENRFCEYIEVLSGASLVVFRPEIDISGADLQVSRRYGDIVLRVQVKGSTAHATRGNLHLTVRKRDLPPGLVRYLLFAEYIPATAEMGRYGWLLHSEDVPRLCISDGDKWEAIPSNRPESRDKFVPYRYELKEVVPAIGALVEKNEEGGTLPRTAGEVRAAAPTS